MIHILWVGKVDKPWKERTVGIRRIRQGLFHCLSHEPSTEDMPLPAREKRLIPGNNSPYYWYYLNIINISVPILWIRT